MVSPQSKKKRLTIAKARRCFEDRYDFTEKDGAAFPIQLEKGGATFGFCPAKILRDDPQTVDIFQTLTAILETGTWPDEGGLNEQEAIWVELVAEYAQYRRDLEFNDRYNKIAKGLSANGFGKN